MADPALFDDEGLSTRTSKDQQATELLVSRCFDAADADGDGPLELYVRDHKHYILASMEGLSEGYATLDASQPWLNYWSFNAIDLLGVSVPDTLRSQIVATLAACQDPRGGYGGGPGQLPHLAATYAAVRALVAVGTEEAYTSINRATLHSWLMSLKRPDGSFATHQDGESDVRAAYCALATASLVNILTPKLVAGAEGWLVRCQTFEGGLGGCPGNEAHGGYAFCGVAALKVLGKVSSIDRAALLRWLCGRQMAFEGGFQGRTGKLVDACYSFWQGAIFQIMADEGMKLPNGEMLLDAGKLARYIIACGQDERGGLRDKPGKSRDLYHTNYALCGLSIAQHAGQTVRTKRTLKPLDAVQGVAQEKVAAATAFFSKLPLPSDA